MQPGKSNTYVSKVMRKPGRVCEYALKVLIVISKLCMPGNSEWENKGSGNQVYGTVGESDPTEEESGGGPLNASAPVVKESG